MDPSQNIIDTVNIYDAEGEWLDEEDDDDMDFEPTTDDSEDAEFFDPSEDPEAEFQVLGSDAEDGLSDVNIGFSMDDGGSDSVTNEGRNGVEVRETHPQPAHATLGRIQVSPMQMMQLLGNAGLRRLFTNHGASDFGALNADDDGEIEDGYGGPSTGRKRRSKGAKQRFPPIPNEEGRKLMDSGTFGRNEHYEDILRKRKNRLSRRLMSRELGTNVDNPLRSNRLISQNLIPSSKADTIIHYNSRCYSGQFSDDGNFFFSCAQDFKVRMYDTSNPYKWKYFKTVVYPYGQWTITDASLSPDNRFLAYSSIRSIVCLAPTDPTESGDPVLLDFSDTGHRNERRRFNGGSHFGIYSIRFSGDGREIVAGTTDHSVYVYDIESRRSVLRIPGHHDDVNAVCFGDASSPHILYSGSDDTLIKIWDRRSMGDSREAGVFMGHTEGLTYVDSKGDGRYVLSNGKDQMMKLWDLRKMMPTERASKIDPGRYTTAFDYRFMAYSETDYQPHPHDCSLVTFRGHRVLKTLIRCHFSPSGSSNSRYVYSGSEDGRVYIYNMDATLAGKVDVKVATHESRPRDPELYHTRNYEMGDRRGGGDWKTCVRDASWHPNAPVIAATSWNGWGMSTGTCTTHSWNDGAEDDDADPKMGLRVDERLELNDDLYGNPRSRYSRPSQFRTRVRSQRVVVATEDDEDWALSAALMAYEKPQKAPKLSIANSVAN